MTFLLPFVSCFCLVVYSRTFHHFDYRPTPGIATSVQRTINVANAYPPSSPVYPGARYNAMSAPCHFNGLMGLCVFGGYGPPGYGHDLWMFAVSTADWFLMESDVNQRQVFQQCSTGTPAFPGSRHGGSLLSYDNYTKLRLYGGTGFDCVGGFGNLADLWEFDIPSFTWVSRVSATEDVNDVPDRTSVPRYPGSRFSSRIWMVGSDTIVFGGGMSSASYRTWIFRNNTSEWEIFLEAAEAPGPAYRSAKGSALWKSEDEETLYSFSGDSGYQAALCTLNVPAKVWSCMTYDENRAQADRLSVRHPGGGEFRVSSSYRDIVFVWGGHGYGKDTGGSIEALSELWFYDMTWNSWLHRTITMDEAEVTSRTGRYETADDYPPARTRSAGGFVLPFGESPVFVVFGGSEGGYRGDPWTMEISQFVFVCTDGHLSDDFGTVCSGRGRCYGPGEPCVCHVVGYGGENCSHYICADGLDMSQPGVCSGHGHCTEPFGDCICDDRYFTTDARDVCFELLCADGNYSVNVSEVCSGHGSCNVENGPCVCSPFEEWKGIGPTDCSVHMCADGRFVDSPLSCNARGTCSPGGDCVCEDPSKWGGSGCEIQLCSDGGGIPVCHGHGQCLEPGGQCFCHPNYTVDSNCSLTVGNDDPDDPGDDPNVVDPEPQGVGEYVVGTIVLGVLLGISLFVGFVVVIICLVFGCARKRTSPNIVTDRNVVEMGETTIEKDKSSSSSESGDG